MMQIQGELYFGKQKINYLDVLVLLIGNNHLYLCTVYSRDNPNLLFSMCGFDKVHHSPWVLFEHIINLLHILSQLLTSFNHFERYGIGNKFEFFLKFLFCLQQSLCHIKIYQTKLYDWFKTTQQLNFLLATKVVKYAFKGQFYMQQFTFLVIKLQSYIFSKVSSLFTNNIWQYQYKGQFFQNNYFSKLISIYFTQQKLQNHILLGISSLKVHTISNDINFYYILEENVLDRTFTQYFFYGQAMYLIFKFNIVFLFEMLLRQLLDFQIFKMYKQ